MKKECDMNKKYAQYGEDYILESLFANKTGFLCDIGAADGIRYSNSRYLIERGWSGLLIEPNPTNYKKLCDLYIDNSRIKIDNVCCYDKDAGNVDFYCDTYDGFGQISTMSYDFKNVCESIYKPNYVEHKISCLKTSSVFDRNSVPHKIDFLSVDCEGVDYEVLSGIDFSKHEIGLVCIENRDQRIHDFMTVNKYKKLCLTEGNVFYEKI